MKIKRKRYSKKVIREHWNSWLVHEEKTCDPSEDAELDACFACGAADGATEKAHILALNQGGLDTVDNIHLLCHICHKDSEYLYGSEYLDWFFARSILHTVVSQGMRHPTGRQLLIKELGL